MNQTEALYQHYLAHPEIETDTRRIKPGQIFFALKGERFNGNRFARQALDMGAVLAVVDEDPGFEDERLFVVEDALGALQNLAAHHRSRFSIPFIGITGSNGKTTTKELVHAVLSKKYLTYTTEGNFNNHIGIPLTLLRIGPDAEMAVVEMGANHQKEIEGYCRYAMPTVGIITNCGKAHLEGFGGVEGVRKGKGELYDYLRAANGAALVMWDYDYLRDMSRGIGRILRYGTRDADIEGRAEEGTQFLQVTMTKGADTGLIKTQLVGNYNLPNVLAAVAIGKMYEVPDGDIKAAIENFIPSNSRSQMVMMGSNTVILDAYNANPTSMKAAIENFAAMEGKDKVLMLGAMAELGEESAAEHRQILDLIDAYSWKNVVLVGGEFGRLEHNRLFFNNAEEAGEWLQQQNLEHAHLLVKGSRSMQMEKVLNRSSH